MGTILLLMLKLTISLSPLLAALLLAEKFARTQNQRVPARVWGSLGTTCLVASGSLIGLTLLLGGAMLYHAVVP